MNLIAGVEETITCIGSVVDVDEAKLLDYLEIYSNPFLLSFYSSNIIMRIERYYLSVPEREDCRRTLIERGYEIDTKLKLAKREFKTGLYIEELLQ